MGFPLFTKKQTKSKGRGAKNQLFGITGLTSNLMFRTPWNIVQGDRAKLKEDWSLNNPNVERFKRGIKQAGPGASASGGLFGKAPSDTPVWSPTGPMGTTSWQGTVMPANTEESRLNQLLMGTPVHERTYGSLGQISGPGSEGK